MASIWKTKVLPKIKKIFSTDKKKAAIQAKLFDKEKETIDKETEEKKEELSPKLLELFEAADPETKALLQSPTEAAVKEKTEAVAKLLKDLAEKGIPGASLLSAAVDKVGVASLAAPITWLLKKVSTFLPPAPTPPPMEATPAAEGEKKVLEVTDKGEMVAKPEEEVAVAANVQQVVAEVPAPAVAPKDAAPVDPAPPAPVAEVTPAAAEVTAAAPAAAAPEPPPAAPAAPAPAAT